MGRVTSISWTDATWNPVRGCSRVSEGCRNCYAEKVAARFSGPGQAYEGLANRETQRWTGKVRLVHEHLEDPIRWKKPRRVFVNSMSDLFHENLPEADIDRIFAAMSRTPRHTFQVLTKRADRMQEYVAHPDRAARVLMAVDPALSLEEAKVIQCNWPWPLPNVWLGVSVEDQRTLDERLPFLQHSPATIRFLSAEPLLGALDLFNATHGVEDIGAEETRSCHQVDWVILGGESGPGSRPLELDWIRRAIGTCREAGMTAVFVKQLGTCWAKARGDLGKGDIVSRWPEDLRVQEFPL